MPDLSRVWRREVWDSILLVLFGVMGVFFVFYGIIGDDQGDVTFGLACLAMAKAAHAMIRTYELEARRA